MVVRWIAVLPVRAVLAVIAAALVVAGMATYTRAQVDSRADLPSGRDRTLVRRTVVSVQPLRTSEGRAANTGVVWIVGGTSSEHKISGCRAPAPARFVDGAKLLKLVCSG